MTIDDQIGYLSILLFFFVLLFLGALFLAASAFIGKKNKSGAKLDTYECGKDPIGPGWRRFNIMYFIVAIAFLLFDVELVFIYPCAVIFREAGFWGFIEVFIFLGILFFGFIYLIRQRVIDFTRGIKR
jgi:NADH-quinone oxidoreductase subunit A